tara:strand:- start:216 stop:554 length:339 start_codon:yes stop_codon:yes gene_type:complete
MIWPPIKAWTSKVHINGQVHFVAINYGGELLMRWVILMSVLDSNLVLNVPWSELVDLSNWEPGWIEINHMGSFTSVNNKSDFKTTGLSHPSFDSGLTMPLSEIIIRPWYDKI